MQATRDGAELGQTTDPYAIIWFCTASDPSVIMPDYSNEMLPVIHSNRIYNANGTGANVTCGYSGPTEATLVPLTPTTAALLDAKLTSELTSRRSTSTARPCARP